MKRVEAIAKGKCSSLSAFLNRKAKRIMRGVEQAIDYASDKIEECNDAAQKAINDLGLVADAGDSCGLQSYINKYLDKIAAKENWEKQLARLKELKKELEADVKLEDED